MVGAQRYVFATPSEWTTENIRLKYEYQHFSLGLANTYIIQENKKNTQDIENFCADESLDRSENISQENKKIWNVDAQALDAFLEEYIEPKINQEVSNVTISKDTETQEIIFEGYGYDGKKLNRKKSVELIVFAIKNGINQVTLSVDTIPAQVFVEDEELKNLGITDVIAVGRSDFYPSSAKRIQNIMAGASRFNGHVIAPGEEFSFNTQLGEVSGETGYAKEYVILGPKVVKEYGGGLCQVSSTAYRGVMLAGLKIVERHNHSFAVNHYKPYGSDATIYQGVKDFRFKNDTENSILIQTRRGGEKNSELFFHYYGTKPERNVKIFGPQMSNYKNPLPEKTTYSTSLPEGKTQKVSSAVRGFNASFERVVRENNTTKYSDQFFSPYQARGKWTIIGGSDPLLSQISSQEIPRNTEKNSLPQEET